MSGIAVLVMTSNTEVDIHYPYGNQKATVSTYSKELIYFTFFKITVSVVKKIDQKDEGWI